MGTEPRDSGPFVSLSIDWIVVTSPQVIIGQALIAIFGLNLSKFLQTRWKK